MTDRGTITIADIETRQAIHGMLDVLLWADDYESKVKCGRGVASLFRSYRALPTLEEVEIEAGLNGQEKEARPKA